MAFDPVLEYQIVAELGNFGKFESVSGGVPDTVFTTHYEAGARNPQYFPGTHEFSDLELKRAYRPDRDAPLFDWDNAVRQGLDGGRPCTIKILNNLGVVVNVFTLPSCKPKGVERPNGVKGSSNIAEITVKLKVEGQI